MRAVPVLLAVAAIGGLVAACALSRGSGEEPVASASPSPAVPSSRPAVDILGVNEAVSYPGRLQVQRRPGAEAMQARLDADARAAAELGARWSRGHTVAYPRLSYDKWLAEDRSYDRADSWVVANQQAGLQMVGMIGPWPGNGTSKVTDVFTPRDMGGYLDFVKMTIERYDGDGVDDMPGLEIPIRVWEIDNEPELKNTESPRSQKSTNFATPAEFAALTIQTAKAIRAADPDATVLNGGLARPTRGHGKAYATELFRQSGMLEAIDAMSVHAYHEGPGMDEFEKTVERARELAPGKPVWMTETSVPTNKGKSWMSDDWQGEIVLRTVFTGLRLDLEHIFWHTLHDPPVTHKAPKTAKVSNSLYARQESGELVRKPAAEAFARSAELLEGLDRSQIVEVPARGGHVQTLGEGRGIAYGDGEVRVQLDATRRSRVLGGAAVEIGGSGEITVDCEGGAVLLER